MGSSCTRDQACVSCVGCQILYHWATWRDENTKGCVWEGEFCSGVDAASRKEKGYMGADWRQRARLLPGWVASEGWWVLSGTENSQDRKGISRPLWDTRLWMLSVQEEMGFLKRHPRFPVKTPSCPLDGLGENSHRRWITALAPVASSSRAELRCMQESPGLCLHISRPAWGGVSLGLEWGLAVMFVLKSWGEWGRVQPEPAFEDVWLWVA